MSTAFVIVLGLCIGSFLNVVILRLPRNESIVRPGSHCACGAPLRWFDNIPIVSWLLLRGNARCCGRPISLRYPAIEAATALLFWLCWRRTEPDYALAAEGWIFLSVLLAGSIIDAEHMIIPESLTLGLGVVGVVLGFAVPTIRGGGLVESLSSGGHALLGLCVGSGLTLWIASLASALLLREAMGMGDVLLVGAIGAFCGWHAAVFSIFGGAFVGLFWVLVALLWRRSLKMTSRLPFGPMLATAAAIYFLFLRTPVEAWFTQVGGLFQ
ncbi:MAG TPA: prepilin peptidase [Opitutaceae bacterium]|jgi:leader peptidase (prepilin peptidase)/N-methyltransferase